MQSSPSLLSHQSHQIKIPSIISRHGTKKRKDSLNKLEEVIIIHEEPQPVISEAQKTILRKTWVKLQKKMDAVGVVSFLRLFETHPETLRPFLHHINAVKEIEMDEW